MARSVTALYDHIRRTLEGVIGDPLQVQAETVLILEEVLHMRLETIYTEGGQPASESAERQVAHVLEMRVEKRIPIQYLLNSAWFYGLKLYVNPHVLIPRPETERLVEEVLSLSHSGASILDVGTGSGAIALALSSRLQEQAAISAVDLSPAALKVARLNQKRLGTRVHFREPGDLLAPVAGERFDLIVSNPPYVDTRLEETLAPEVRGHEPSLALFSPEADPLHFYRRLADESPQHLNAGGWLLVEAGAGMTPDIAGIFKTHGFKNIEVIADYAGLDRVVKAQR